MAKALRELQEALEVGMYYGETKEQYRLKRLLTKLGIKSAAPVGPSMFAGYASSANTSTINLSGGALTIESLEETLKRVTSNIGKP